MHKNPRQTSPLLMYEHELCFWVSFEPQTKSKLNLDTDSAPSPVQNTQEF